LGHDVRGGEDRLQVEPRSLNLQPLINDLLNKKQFGFPFPEKEKKSQWFAICPF